MTVWICNTCGVENSDIAEPSGLCAICADDRQYVRPSGQRWVTLTELATEGRHGAVEEVEPGLLGVTVQPGVGIGQRALLARTEYGNLLWDPVGYLDDELVRQVEAAGGVAAIAASHPHMFGVQVEWSRRFGDVPVYVSARDAEWIQRDADVIRRWDDAVEALPGLWLHRIGGHFRGSAVALWPGADGQGVLLSGDTVVGTPDEKWASFLRSFPNKIPFSAGTITRIIDRLAPLRFDRLYDNLFGRIAADADAAVRRSAERYIGWVSGDFDDLT